MSTPPDILQIPRPVRDRLRGRFLSEPREISGRVLSVIEVIVGRHAGRSPTARVEEWYRSAATAEYADAAAAAAYLGAYGARSILKLQESVLAALLLGKAVRRRTRVVDFGCGPYVGLLALADVWSCLAEGLGERLSITYVPVDRSSAMLDMGEVALGLLGREPGVQVNVERSAPLEAGSDLLIVSNVLNEGEGEDDPARGFAQIVAGCGPKGLVLAIEPATEYPCRQLCTLDRLVPGLTRVGPCPRVKTGCTEWSFRKFSKRTYAVERQCLGEYASAAEECKFGLAIYTVDGGERLLEEGTGVVVGQRRADRTISVCFGGDRRRLAVDPSASAWDVVNSAGQIVRRWP